MRSTPTCAPTRMRKTASTATSSPALSPEYGSSLTACLRSSRIFRVNVTRVSTVVGGSEKRIWRSKLDCTWMTALFGVRSMR
eukprot:705784-Rhodomonas_salina.3